MRGFNSLSAVGNAPRVSKRILLQRLVSFRVVGEYAEFHYAHLENSLLKFMKRSLEHEGAHPFSQGGASTHYLREREHPLFKGARALII